MKTRLVVLLLLSMSFSVVAILPETVRATTLYVGGAGPGNYTTIQEAINATSPGDTVFVYSGTYYEHLVVQSPLTLIGEEKETTVLDGSEWGSVVLVITEWANVSGFTIMNSGSDLYDAGIELRLAQNCWIHGNDVLKAERGIYLGTSDDNRISQNSIMGEWYGIYVSHSDGNTIDSNTVYGGQEGIILHHSNDNAIVNSTLDSITHGIILRYSESNSVFSNSIVSGMMGVYVLGPDNVVANNEIRDNYWGAIEVKDSSNVTVTGNLMDGNGIRISGNLLEYWRTHAIDASNTVNGGPVLYWADSAGGTIPAGVGQVILANCTDIVVEGLDVRNATFGIQIGFSSNITIINNTVSGNQRGISLTYSNRSRVIDNNAHSNHDDAILLLFSRNITVARNNVSSNECGIALYHSNYNSILRNTALSNNLALYASSSYYNSIEYNIASDGRSAFRLYNFINGTVSGNVISGNRESVELRFSAGNTLYRNTFRDNEEVAFDDGENQWDKGYPLGGNYWSDYNGTDQSMGPNQDETGSDGIGDTPVDISGGQNKDRYPLMLPIGSPSRPTNLQAVSGNQQVALTWNPPDDWGTFQVTNYIIYRGSSPGTETPLAQIGNSTAYTDTGLANGQLYSYKVSALNAVGEGDLSNGVNATPAFFPGPAENFVASPKNQAVLLEWTPPTDDGGYPIVSYNLYRGMSSGELELMASTNVTQYVDTGLTNGVYYFYVVTAVSEFGEGSKSKELSANPYNIRPECNITSPLSSETVSEISVITGQSFDVDGSVQRVEIRMDEGGWIVVNGTSQWSFEWDSTSVPDGNHLIFVRCYDGTDYSDEVFVFFRVHNPLTDKPMVEQTWFWVAVILVAVFMVAALIIERRSKRNEPEE